MIRLLLVAALLGPASYPTDAQPEPVDCSTTTDRFGGLTDDDGFTVVFESESCTATPGVDGGPVVITHVVRLPLPFCDEPGMAANPRPCIPDTGPTMCSDGSRPLGQQYTRTIIGGEVGPWRLTDPGGCPQPPELDPLVTHAFTTAVLTPTTATRHPAGPEGLVNMPLVLAADPTPQTWSTTLAGWAVTITATPTTYTWDLGGAVDPITTTDPGAPYPHHTLAPVLPRTGTFPITLTTAYTGTYRIGTSGPLHPITGTVTTTTSLDPLTVLEARTRLVADTL